MPACLERLHRQAPIAEVIVATATESRHSAWDLWSAKQQALPTAIEGIVAESGQTFLRQDPWRRKLGGEDYARACQARPLIQTRACQEFSDALCSRSVELHERAEVAARQAAESSTEPALIPILPAADPRPSHAERAALGPHRLEECALLPGGRIVALVPDHYPYKLAVLDPGQPPRLIMPSFDLNQLSGLNAAGTRCLAIQKEQVVEIDLESGEEVVVHTRPHRLGGGAVCAYLDDNTMVTSEAENVLLLTREPPERRFAVVGQIKAKAHRVETALGRFVFLSTGKDPVVLGVKDGALKKLGSVKAGKLARFRGVRQGKQERVLVRTETGLFEVVNLERAFAKKLPAQPARG